jgi:hypothetical protein
VGETVKLQLRDRLAELPYRVRPRRAPAALTWRLSEADRARLTVTWPTRYQWAPAGGIVETLRDGLRSLGVLRSDATAQRHSGAVMLECVVDGARRLVGLDMSDYPDLINEQALEQSDLYFKGQFREGGYGIEKILPAGYTVTGRDFYRYYVPFRERYRGRRQVDVVARFGFRFQETIRRCARPRTSASSGRGGRSVTAASWPSARPPVSACTCPGTVRSRTGSRNSSVWARA